MSTGKLAWVRRTARDHRVLSSLLAAYLVLSAVELVRVLLYDRPREYDAGFYQPEPLNMAEGPREFLWTRGDAGYILRPLWAPVLRVPIYVSHPQLPDAGVTVRFYADEALFDEQTIGRNGWHRFDYYLPPILGTDPWREQAETMSLEGVAELDPMRGEGPFSSARWILRRKPDYVRVFSDWHIPPGPPSQWFRIEVSETFVPADFLDTKDRRELGVGVGEILWSAELPPGGIGNYGIETDRGEPFRWSRARSHRQVAAAPPGAEVLRFRARVASPDAAEDPIEVTFLWNATPVARLSFDSREWQEVRLAALPGGTDAGVLSAFVSRVWNAAEAGQGKDSRDLGVALTEPHWQ